MVGLSQKIAQMLMIGFRGVSLGDNPRIEKLARIPIGGVILFDKDVPSNSYPRNITSPEQLASLTRQLQSLHPEPLLIAIDQEGGYVNRLKSDYGFPDSFSHAYLGEKDKADFTFQAASQTAKLLKKTGINLNLAPCVDVNVNPDNPIIGTKKRSFSSEPEVVIKHARQFILAHRQHGILTSLKHFPGHGSSTRDSHLGMVDVTHTWQERELLPYQHLLQENLADSIVTAHLFNSRLDEHFPATLSHSTLTLLLRQKLKYNGVIISDDMQMGAIRQKYGFEDALIQAVQAGVDILLFGNNSNQYDEQLGYTVIDILLKAVNDGNITPERIDASYERIKRLKTNLEPLHESH